LQIEVGDTCTVVGNGAAGGRDGPGLAVAAGAMLTEPSWLAANSNAATVLISEPSSHRIRKWASTSRRGDVSTLAGGSRAGFENGKGTAALVAPPRPLSFVTQVGLCCAAPVILYSPRASAVAVQQPARRCSQLRRRCSVRVRHQEQHDPQNLGPDGGGRVACWIRRHGVIFPPRISDLALPVATKKSILTAAVGAGWSTLPATTRNFGGRVVSRC
jgi:hypothetical protein